MVKVVKTPILMNCMLLAKARRQWWKWLEQSLLRNNRGIIIIIIIQCLTHELNRKYLFYEFIFATVEIFKFKFKLGVED